MSFWLHSERYLSCNESKLLVSAHSFRVASPVGRVTTFSLIYVHNLRLPLFAQYDMPEKYDLARECITPLIAESC